MSHDAFAMLADTVSEYSMLAPRINDKIGIIASFIVDEGVMERGMHQSNRPHPGTGTTAIECNPRSSQRTVPVPGR